MSNLVKYKIKNISELELQLFITIPKENIKKELNKEYENISSKIKINGFRIGKVPKNIIQQHYKINIIKTIFNKILKNSIDLVMKEKKLIPVSIPKIDSTDKFDINKNFSFTAIFYIKPKITIKKWKQLNLKISSYLITEKSIEKELKQIQMHYSKLITLKTRTIIKNNDFVKIKYKLITNESNYKKEKFIEKIIKIGNNSLYKEVE